MKTTKVLLFLCVVFILFVGAISFFNRSLPEGGEAKDVMKNIFVISSSKAEAAQKMEQEVSYPITPSYLRIPALAVATDVQHVGRTLSGNMAVPTNYSDVGWYRHGSRPGEPGNAVIAGHLDNGFGLDAVFAHLHELSPGDEIIVGNDAKESIYFKVIRSEVMDVEDFPSEYIFSTSGTAGLVLITCEGAWDAQEKEYEKRLVVYAERVTR